MTALKRRASREESPRSGTVLILFALLLIPLLGLLALGIDLGFAKLARRQLQTAADTASVEGLRWRDRLPPGPDLEALGEDPTDPTLLTRQDEIRRRMARALVRNQFADDSGGTGAGAGPVAEFTDGIEIGGGFRASAQYSPEDFERFIPEPELNLDDEAFGDMVAGTRIPGVTPDETDTYLRDDFAVAPGGDAFLVRLRRTGEDFSGSTEVASSGPPLPFLFGRGALLRAEGADPQAILARRERGTRVRATSIADLRPALSVGVPVFRGVSPGVFELLRSGVAFFLSRSAPLNAAGLQPVPGCLSSCCGGVVIGDPALPGIGTPIPDGTWNLFLAVYDDVNFASPGVVVGFYHVTIQVSGGVPVSLVPAGNTIVDNGLSTFARTCQLDPAQFEVLMVQAEDLRVFARAQGLEVRSPARVRATR